MTVAIDFQLDEVPVVSSEELFGRISVCDGVQTLSETDTYLDSWLGAFVEALEEFYSTGSGRSEVVDEPAVVSMAMKGARLEVSVGATKLYPGSATELHEALRDASRRLLAAVPPEQRSAAPLARLSRFAGGAPPLSQLG